MRMSHSKPTLSEQLVREHIEAARKEMAAAVERALSEPSTTRRAKATGAGARGAVAGRRRAKAELAALEGRLYEAICAHPGETIAVIAPTVSSKPRERQRPMMALKQAGRVRSVGQRHQMRYYSAVGRSSSGRG